MSDPDSVPRARLLLPASLFGRRVYYGWYIVAFTFLATMMSAGISAYGLGVFVTPMTEELGWSRTDIALGQTIATGVSGMLGLFIGGPIDRRGGRELVVLGSVITGVGYILLGQVHELWQYYLIKSGVLTFGSAFMGGMVLNIAVSNWFVRYRGRAIAITAMGISVGAIVMPILATRAIETFGWRATWTAIGVLIWAVVIPPAWLVLRRRPEDHGLEPDGGAGQTPRGNNRLAAQRAATDGMRWTRREAIRTPALWMLIITFGLASMGYGAMFLHLIPFLTDSGYSARQAAGAFSMIGVAGLLSKPIWGLIAERVVPRYCAASEFALLGLGILLVMAAPSLATMYVAIFVLGLGIGGVVTVQETVWADYYGRLTLGTVRSIGRPFTIVFSAGGPVFASLAYDFRDSYEIAFVLFVVAYVAAALLILVTPAPRKPAAATTDTVATPLPETPVTAPAG